MLSEADLQFNTHVEVEEVSSIPVNAWLFLFQITGRRFDLLKGGMKENGDNSLNKQAK